MKIDATEFYEVLSRPPRYCSRLTVLRRRQFSAFRCWERNCVEALETATQSRRYRMLGTATQSRGYRMMAATE
jgi:hypothetical protein